MSFYLVRSWDYFGFIQEFCKSSRLLAQVLGPVEDRAGVQVKDRVEAQAQDLARGQVEDQARDRVKDLAMGLGLNQSLIEDSLQLLCHICHTCIFCNHHVQKQSTMSSSQQVCNSRHLR